MSSGFDKDFNTILVDFEKRINERLDNQEYILKTIHSSYQSDSSEQAIKEWIKKLEMLIAIEKAPQKSSRFEDVKQTFINCFSTSTGHGLPQMVKAGNIFLNIFWLVFFLVAFGGGCSMIYQSIDQYMQFDVITMTKIIRETQIIFPALTFCSYDNLHEKLIYCHYDISKDICNFKTLTLYSDARKYNCLQLNHGTNKSELVQATGEDWKHGYQIIFYNVSKDSQFQFAVTNNKDRVAVNDVKDVIYSGYETDVILSKISQTALGRPYSDCNETNGYREATCIDDCFNQQMGLRCGCKYPKECLNKTDSIGYKCVNSNDSKTDSILLKCKLKCPTECNLISFPSTRTDIVLKDSGDLSDYKDKLYEKLNKTSNSSDGDEHKMIVLYFYFRKLETNEITQSPSMSVASLVADVGGLLGLFLGFSLLSTIEILDLVIRVCLILNKTGGNQIINVDQNN